MKCVQVNARTDYLWRKRIQGTASEATEPASLQGIKDVTNAALLLVTEPID
jgi:hypothetical protein